MMIVQYMLFCDFTKITFLTFKTKHKLSLCTFSTYKEINSIIIQHETAG